MTSHSAYIGIDEIRALFKKHWNLNIKRPSVYFYMKPPYNFPTSTGRGCPRMWVKTEVTAWFKSQEIKR